MIFIGYAYEVHLSVVIYYDVGMDQSLFTSFKEWFKLRICVKRRGKSQNSEAGNFREIGHSLSLIHI